MDTKTVAHRHHRNTSTKTTKPAPRCEGCGETVAHVFEVVDSLTFFAGDFVCRECANNSGSETV